MCDLSESTCGASSSTYDSPRILQGGFSWNPNIRDSLFIGNGRGTAVWGPESEDFYADGLTIVNYGRSGALAGCLGCNSDEHYKQGGYTYR